MLVTSKVVSKAEGRVVPGTREEALPGETARVVARRGPTTIVRTHHGLTLAAAGIDASNVAPGTRRAAAGRPGRLGPRAAGTAARAAPAATSPSSSPTPRAAPGGTARPTSPSAPPGCASLEDYAGRRDDYGNDLVVTAPAVADELAGAAELAQGKLGGRPFAVVRGRADLVLPADDDGPGAVALVRPEGTDMFGFGAREAVLRALRGDPADPARRSARPRRRAEMAEALAALTGAEPGPDGGGPHGPRRARLRRRRARPRRSPTAGRS